MAPLAGFVPRLLLILAVGLLTLAVVYFPARTILAESRAKSYHAMLAVEAERIEQWIAVRRATARHMATNPELVDLARRLTGARATPCADEAASRRQLETVLQNHQGSDAPLAAHLMRPDGTIVASLFPGYCGKQLQAQVTKRLNESARRSLFLAPIEESRRIESIEHAERPPMVWFEAPVSASSGGKIAFFGFGLDAREHFDRLFTRRGDSIALLAFDADGRPIAGPGAASGPWLASALNAAGQARAASGEVMEPYRSTRGGEVVAAWRWLERDSIGIAMEVDVMEAFRPLRPLQAVMAFGLLLLIGLAVAYRYLPRIEGALPTGPRRIGPYRIDAILGEGSISTVYRATHVRMKRVVAVKVLKLHAANDEFTARFRREVQLTHRLRHPNFVHLYDYGHAPGFGFYCAMEYVPGLTFAELVEAEGPQPPERVARLLAEVCQALDEAHRAGLLHRDIKPQNLMLSPRRDGTDAVKVLDFGLVKEIDADPTRDLTRHVNLLGTLAYLAPERISNPAGADPRSDLYAVGAVGYFLLTGKRPFEPPDGSEQDPRLTHRILHETAPRASADSPYPVPPALDELIAACLAKDPARRPASAAAMLDVLAGAAVAGD